MAKPRKILVPTDFSEHSDKALQKALELAQESDASITLLHIISQEFKECMSDYCFTPDELERLRKGLVESSEEYMKTQLSKVDPSRAKKITTAIRHGVPYEEILRYQSENDFDLIVIASHGRSAIARYLMGSVATKVVSGAKCEVLVLK